MAQITTGQIVAFLDANLNEGWQDGLKRWPEEYAQVAKVSDSTKSAEKDSYESGFGAMPAKPEGQAATYDTLIPGVDKTYVHTTYALGYEITEEAIEDNLNTPETFAKLPQALNGAAMETVEVSFFNIFNNGFSTNGFDGVPLFSASHPLLSGGTQSNTPSTQADLSVTSLQNGITAFGQFKDERGLNKACYAKKLMVGVANQFVVEELLKSEYKPYTANNERNAIMSHDLVSFVSHYLTDDDAWFLLGEDHMIKFIWRVRLGALRKSTDFDTTNLKHLARMRFSTGYSHYKETYGSSGA
jgi:hypothetical protein